MNALETIGGDESLNNTAIELRVSETPVNDWGKV